MHLNDTSRQAIVSTSAMMLAAACAASALIFFFLGSPKLVFGLIAAFLFVTALVACGNIRLFFLWGLILSAPLELNVSFNVIKHIGGAAALHIDASDLFLIPLMVFLVRDLSEGYRSNIRIPRVIYWWLGLAFLGILTMLIGPLRQAAGLEVIRMVKLTLLFLVIVNEVVRVRQVGHVVAALIIAVAIQSGAALIQYVLDLNFGAQILGEVTVEGTEYTSRATYQDGGFTNRPGGLFGHPNLLSIFLAILLPIGLSILFSNINPVYKFLTSIVVAMGLIALILTLSRSGWISFTFAFIALMSVSFLDRRLRNKYVFGRVISILMIFVLAAALSGPIMKRLTESDTGAVSFRWEFMEVAMRMVAEKPILGFGLNSFVWHMPPFTEYKSHAGVVAKFGEHLPVVHNIYLLVWVEQGTIGLILYLAFYFHLLRIGWRGLTLYQQPFLAMVNLGCFAGLLALMVDGAASFFIRNGNCGRIFIIVAALMVAIQWWHFDNMKKPTNFKQAA